MIIITCRLFGVHTLQEVQAVVNQVYANAAKGIQTILLLGILPARLVAPLSFLRHVILVESDSIPSNDIQALRTVFDIGVSQVIHSLVDGSL